MKTIKPLFKYTLWLLLVILLLAACSRISNSDTIGALQSKNVNYEVWAIDQGTNKIHIVSPNLEVKEVVNLTGVVDMPHMITFDSQYRYAFIASVASGNTVIVRVADREVVAVLPSGPSSHMAAVTPDDSRLHVDVIGAGKIVEYKLDLEDEKFEWEQELIITEDPAFQTLADAGHPGRPVCHVYTQDGRYAYVTLGPALTYGGLAILDVEKFELERVYDTSQVNANCGVALTVDGKYMFVNGGSLDTGVWYVLDTSTHKVVHQGSSSGMDAHGTMAAPNGREIWMVNRATSNAVVIDAQTFETVAEMGFVGKSPDIIGFSPDSRYLFVTLRGPKPRSGPHAIGGDTPGVSVIDVRTREIVTILEPDKGNENSDFHGIGIVPLPN